MQKFKSLQELFADEKRWCQKDSRINAQGAWVVNDEEACSWCLEGGLFMVYPDADKRITARTRLSNILGMSIERWNDDPARTINDVRRLVKEAGV